LFSPPSKETLEAGEDQVFYVDDKEVTNAEVLFGALLVRHSSNGNEDEVNAWADDVVSLGEDYMTEGVLWVPSAEYNKGQSKTHHAIAKGLGYLDVQGRETHKYIGIVMSQQGQTLTYDLARSYLRSPLQLQLQLQGTSS